MASHLSGSTATDQEDCELDELRLLLAHLFAFSYAWALGGNLVHTLREAFHAHTKEVFADLLALPDGSLLDHYVEVQPGHQPAFRPWASAVPTFKRTNTSLQQQILVPTVDTVRIAFIVEVCLLQRPLGFHMCGLLIQYVLAYCLAGVPGRAAPCAANRHHRRRQELGGCLGSRRPARTQGRPAVQHKLQRTDFRWRHTGPTSSSYQSC